MTFTRSLKSAVGASLLLAGGIIASAPAQAVPAFARQTGMACLSCHFQNFPALNSFGRAFKAGGYTMRGAQGLIEGEDLSLPDTLNMSFVMKLRYTQNDATEGGRGSLDVPDETAFLVGGRIAENAGFLTEIGMIHGDAGMLGYKTQFNVTENFAVNFYATDALGAGYGFELLNTGFQRSQRPIESRVGYSAMQLTGVGAGAAEGLAFVYHTDSFFVNVSHYAPAFGNADVNLLGGMVNYVRGAYTPTIGGWDVGVGAGMVTGTMKVGADPADVPAGYVEVKVDGMGIDAQAQGEIGGMSAGFYGSYSVAGKSSGTVANSLNADTTEDKTAMGALAKLGFTNEFKGYVAYSTVDGGGAAEATNRTTVGVQYDLAQNIGLDLFNQGISGGTDDSVTQLVFFAGF